MHFVRLQCIALYPKYSTTIQRAQGITRLCYDRSMIYEIISVLLLIDSALAVLFGFTKLGDDGIEQMTIVRRYIPLTKGWTLLYLCLSCYIAFLTFVGI